jgi:iron-chelate-transporting ATPase
MFTLENVHVQRGRKTLLSIEHLAIHRGQLTVVLGNNGSGKSTLLQLLSRQLEPDRGSVRMLNKPLHEYSARQFARSVAFMPQHLPDASGLTVKELVRLGRFPWRGLFRPWTGEDQQLTQQAMGSTDVARHADQALDVLSGGERQRAWIAMLLAQRAAMLLLDEPTSALDLAHQHTLMALLRQLNQREGVGMILVLHDINMALRTADRIIALKGGRVFFDGSVTEFQSDDLLSRLYDIPIALVEHVGAPGKIAVVQSL